jgi:hypothetical protein
MPAAAVVEARRPPAGICSCDGRRQRDFFIFSFVGPAGQLHGADDGPLFFIFMKMIAMHVTLAHSRVVVCTRFRPVLLVTFFAVCHRKHTANPLCRVRRYKTHDKDRLLCNNLSCGLCLAFSRKTHDKGITVRPKHTAKAKFPVVNS